MATKTNTDIDALLEAAANTANETILLLEDCKCPICLDYFIDVVETRCRHRFCNFCLENWLRVSATRQCPTCRRTIQEPVLVKVDLQETINACIRPTLSEDVLRERFQIRIERQAQTERYLADRAQTQALLARISSTRHRNRLIRRSRRSAEIENYSRSRESRTPLLSRHIMNWWDDNNQSTTASENHPYSDRVLNELDTENTHLDWYHHNNEVNNDDHNAYFASTSQEGLNTAPLPNVFRTFHVGPEEGHQRTYPRDLSSNFDQAYHENLMHEYSYHLQRINYAHTRIRNAYRDFNYHNGRMQEILREHRSFFSNMGTTADNRANGYSHNYVGYDNYEALMRAELGELLDNSPAAQVLFGEYIAANAEEFTELSSFDRTCNFSSGSPDGFVRNPCEHTPRPTHLFNGSECLAGTHMTNASEMRHEINNRRMQPNTLSTFIRQYPWTAEETREYSLPRELLTRPSGSISSLRTHLPNRAHPETSNDSTFPRDSGRQTVVDMLVGTGGARVRSSRARGMRNRSTGNCIYPSTYSTRVHNSFEENVPLSEIAQVVTLNEIGTSGDDVAVSHDTTNGIPNNAMSPNITSIRRSSRRRTVHRSGQPFLRDNFSSDSENEDGSREITSRIARRYDIVRPLPEMSRTSTVLPNGFGRFRTALNIHRQQCNLTNQDTEGPSETVVGSSISNTNESPVNEVNHEIQIADSCVAGGVTEISESVDNNT